MIEGKDIDYLDEQFPKGKSQERGKALVLLALARLEGEKKREEEILKIINDILFKEEFGYDDCEAVLLRTLKKKIKEKEQ